MFYVDAGLSALSVLLLVAFLHEAPRARSRSTLGRLAVQSLRDVLQLPAVRGIFLVYLFFALGTTAVGPFLPLWIRAAARSGVPALLAGPPAYMIGLVMTIGGIAMTVSGPAFGWLGDKSGARRTLLATLAGNGLFLALQAIPSLSLVSMAMWWQGFFRGGVTPNLMTLLARAAPEERRAAVMNLSLLPQQISWFAGPAAGTALAAGFGLQGMFIACGFLALLSAPLLFVVRAGAAVSEAPSA